MKRLHSCTVRAQYLHLSAKNLAEGVLRGQNLVLAKDSDGTDGAFKKIQVMIVLVRELYRPGPSLEDCATRVRSLPAVRIEGTRHSRSAGRKRVLRNARPESRAAAYKPSASRSEERRVGKECRCRWWPYH